MSAGRDAAVFLDRDGTLMRDVDYCADPRKVEVFAGAGAALTSLKEAGFRLVIITNQSGIGRGYITEENYRAVEQELERQLGAGLIDATYHCPHAPDESCSCRKPAPEMVQRAAAEHQLDLAKSYFIGDKETDLACGRSAGTKTILVQTGYGQSANTSLADFVAPDLAAAAKFILASLPPNETIRRS